MNKYFYCAVAIPVLAINLTGCLGNDGNGPVGAASSSSNTSTSTGSTVTLPTTPVTITAANAPTVAATSIDTAFGTTKMSPIGVQIDSDSTAISAKAIGEQLAHIGVDALQQLAAANDAPAIVVGAVTSQACAVSGTISVNETSPTSGTLTYTDCSYAAGSKIAGTITLTGKGTTPTGGTTGDLTLDLTITSTADTIIFKGDMSIAYDSTASAVTIKGKSLVVSSTVNGSRALQNYTISRASNGDSSLTFDYASTMAGGTATFTTTTPFHTNTGAKYPSAGVATVKGASSTQLKITVLGDENAAATSQVQLEVSSDGGTTYAAPTQVTWASFKLTY